MRGIRTSRLLAATLAALALMRGTVAAQGASAPAMKAAFLYNFAKFADWPVEALAPGQPLALCVVGEAAVADALEQMIKQQVVDGHALTVRTIEADGPIRSCHLLYVGGLDARQSAQVFETLKGAAVLSVGDGERFADAGGVAQLLIERDRMRFAINVTSAQRARIVLSSKLLSLAKIVKDERDVQQ
jgi:hypothetical protein